MNEIRDIKIARSTINEGKLNCLYFSTDTCNVCKVLKPKIIEIIDSRNNKNINFYYINTDTLKESIGEYMVFSVPVIAFFYKGREIKRFNRYVSYKEIEGFVKKYEEMIFN